MSETFFKKDTANKTLIAERIFEAPPAKVWQAHTQSELLEQWWAPKPWKAVTKSFDFREGGHWLYYMLGPDGTKSWCLVEYRDIEPGKSFSGDDSFCDENGEQNNDMPSMAWKTEFFPENNKTKLVSTISFTSEAALEKIISMGMQEGYTQGLNQLEEILNEEPR